MGSLNRPLVHFLKEEAKLVSMSEAEEMASKFIGSKREGYKVNVQGTAKTHEGWTVKGTVSKSEPGSHTSTEWELTIEGDEIVAYAFGKGTGWAIS